jgi:preprotein translocase subunit SecD
MRIHPSIPMLRIVPDDTKFDFMRFRRISFPVSALLSIIAIVLFFIGTGAVRGFAVTLGIGIVTTVFTAFTLTRLIVAWWVRYTRPQRLAIS